MDRTVESVDKWCAAVASSPLNGLMQVDRRLTVEESVESHGPIAGVLHLWRGRLLAKLDRDMDAMPAFTRAAKILQHYPEHRNLIASIRVSQARLFLYNEVSGPVEQLLESAGEFYRDTGDESGASDVQMLSALAAYQRLSASGAGGSMAALSAVRQAALGFARDGQPQVGIFLLSRVLMELDDEARRTNDALFAMRQLRLLADMNGDDVVALWRPVVEAWAQRDPLTRHTGVALDNLGVHARDTGDLETAYEYGKRALDVLGQIPGGEHDMAICLNNVGTTLMFDGDLGQAARLFSEEHRLLTEFAPRSPDMVVCLSALGTVRQRRGDMWGAGTAFEHAVELAEELGERTYHWANAVVNASGYAVATGTAEETTVARLRMALDYFRADPSPPHVAGALAACYNLAATLLLLGRPAEIEPVLREAVALGARHAPDSFATAAARTSLAIAIVAAQPESDDAHHLLDEAVASLGMRAPDSPGYHQALLTRGGLHRSMGRPDEAIADLAAAVDVLETLRVRAGEISTFRIATLEANHVVYRSLVQLLIDRDGPGDREAAFRYQELCQARSLIDQMHEQGGDLPADTPEQAEILGTLGAVEHRLSAARAALTTSPEAFVRFAGSAGVDAVKERVAGYMALALSASQLREEAESLRSALRELQPARAVIVPEPVSSERVAARIRAAGRTAAIAFFITDTGLVVRMFRANGIASTVTLQIDMIALIDDVHEVVGSMQQRRRSPLPERHAAADRIASALLAPLPADLFDGVDDLILVPDGLLHYLPFELLPSPDGRLVAERWRTTYVPSLSVLESLISRRTERTWEGEFAGFGDPVLPDSEDSTVEEWLASRHRHLVPLPGTRVEVEQIAKLFDNAEVVLGEDFTEAAVRQRVGRYRYVHLATHGLLDDGDPLYCGLAVSPPRPSDADSDDSFLQAYELPGLQMTAEVVVCSACQTGLGRLSAGEGLNGLTQSLLAAGVNTVVVSLWPVGDAITVRFMTAFYTALRSGCDAAEALHTARASTRDRHPDPYHWAAFIGVGLGR